MIFSKLRRVPLAVATYVVCLSAQAGGYTSPDGKFLLSGFGTLGAVVMDTDDVRYSYGSVQPKGATTKPSLSNDSKIALQGTYKFTPTISATSQIMVKQSVEDSSYTPNVEWAFAKWQALPSVAVRLGRMGAPLFMISDFRDVGYANTFVRPPDEVYGQVPFSTVDGGDISVQHSFGPVTLTGQLWNGNTHPKFGTAQVDVRKMTGLNIVAEIDGGLTVRLGHVDSKLSYTSPELQGAIAGVQFVGGTLAGFGFDSSAAEFSAAESLLTVVNAKSSFDGVGVSYDSDTWLFNAEYTKRKTESFVVDSTGWYASVGHRFGSFTPYVGFAQLKTDRKSINPISAANVQYINDNVGAGLAAVAQGVSAGVDQVVNGGQDQKTTTLGVRWDAASGVAVKAQWDQVKTNGTNGYFNGATTAYRQGQPVNVLTVLVDFVF